nr:hypothetical protein CFP56_02000 [Quercus suber]
MSRSLRGRERREHSKCGRSQIPPIPLENPPAHDHIARGRELLHGDPGNTATPLAPMKDLTLAMTTNPMSPSPAAI